MESCNEIGGGHTATIVADPPIGTAAVTCSHANTMACASSFFFIGMACASSCLLFKKKEELRPFLAES